MMVRPSVTWAVPSFATLLAGCALRGVASGQGACAAVAAPLSSGVSLAPMAGRFVMTLVATAGAASGRSIGGYLTLRVAPPETPAIAPSVRTPFIGTTDIQLEAVGALRLGDTGSDDPRAPGVAVYEQRSAAGAPTIIARIGSVITAPPPTGMLQIEGSYTVLYVRRVTPNGFAGGWQSGDGRNDVRGHFCAERIG